MEDPITGLFPDLSCLSVRDKNLVLSIISIISEHSFRRGFDHGVRAQRDGRVTYDPAELRKYSFFLSPQPHDGKGGTFADARLEIEHGVALRALGFVFDLDRERRP